MEAWLFLPMQWQARWCMASYLVGVSIPAVLRKFNAAWIYEKMVS